MFSGLNIKNASKRDDFYKRGLIIYNGFGIMLELNSDNEFKHIYFNLIR